ncbi:MAG TPA: hypothetical protein VEK13_05605 [Thermoplasmata archaeon]|nr:hypothetical protein [Thermoplasmata archaeon]
MTRSTEGPGPSSPIRIESPPEIRLHGIHPVPRVFHGDPRGFLVETLRVDDPAGAGSHFRMSYTSLTRPGQFRDADRWHVHEVQTDRFIVLLGEMILALCDRRRDSPTRDRLAVVRMVGAPYVDRAATGASSEPPSFLVPIPPGVLHCIGNLSSEPFVLQNFPTELYNPQDEGRVPFAELPIPSLGRPFSWDLVPRPPAPR